MNAIIKEKEREIMRIEPFGERVAIRVLESEETTESGLIIANPNKLSSNRGEVVALGNEVKDFFKIGDTLIFTQGAGTNYTDGNAEYRIINTKDVLCKLIED